MIAPINASCFVSSVEELQVRFLGILPRIEQHARIAFRHVACREKRTDLVAETVALAWRWFKRLAERGKDATQFPSVLANYAARAVKQRPAGLRPCTRPGMPSTSRLNSGTASVWGNCPISRPSPPIRWRKPWPTTRVRRCPTKCQFRCDFPGVAPNALSPQPAADRPADDRRADHGCGAAVPSVAGPGQPASPAVQRRLAHLL